MKKGYEFESETDTEIIAKLIQHIADKNVEFSFRQLVEVTVQHLVGLFFLIYQFILINWQILIKFYLKFYDYDNFMIIL